MIETSVAGLSPAVKRRLAWAAEVLLFHNEYTDVDIVSADGFREAVWLLGRGDREDEVSVRQWFDGHEFERTVPIAEIEFPAATLRRLASVVRAQEGAAA